MQLIIINLAENTFAQHIFIAGRSKYFATLDGCLRHSHAV